LASTTFSWKLLAHQNAGRLRHRLDHQALGHHREAREVVVHVLLGQRDVLDRHGAAAALELNELIYPNPAHGIYDLRITIYDLKTPNHKS
jgi:hypothetical protein